MACYRPLPALQQDPGGRVRIFPPLGTENLQLPCGKCLGCRADRAAQWGDRCTHEAKQYQHNTFCTLTYDDTHLPQGGHLVPEHLRNFLKRLRQAAARARAPIATDRTKNIKFFACGEYGKQTTRPHYHLILFNCDFTDKTLIGGTTDLPRYSSEGLKTLWPYGLNDLGNFTPAAATYIAKYTVKQWHMHSDDGYADENGEWHPRPRPFGRMSLRPAIGKTWLEQNLQDLAQGYLVTNLKGVKRRIPRTYLTKIKQIQPELHALIQYNQQQQRLRTPPQNLDPARRADAEHIHEQLEARAEAKRSL